MLCSSWVICVYCDDSWARDDVGKVLQVLARDLHLHVSAYKTDANVSATRRFLIAVHKADMHCVRLQSILGIDSKHPTGIKSSKWSVNGTSHVC